MSMNEASPLSAKSSAILIAALSLSSLQINAQEIPSESKLSFKQFDYQEQQPGLKRVGVKTTALGISMPIASAWSLDSTIISDQVSGASPRYHTAISSASKMSDKRTGADVKLSRYFHRAKVDIGFAYSNEHDYLSRAISTNLSLYTEDQNTSVSLGLGKNKDRIHPTGRSFKESRQGNDYILSASHVVSAQDLLLLSTSYSRAEGYFSDPYKSLDIRPRERQQRTYLLRWNHYFLASDGSLRMSYRHYRDSYQVRSHTLQLEYAQPVAGSWLISPMMRLYSQTAAQFYYDPDYSFLFVPKTYVLGSGNFITEDQRLSAFGGRSFGLKIEKNWNQEWGAELKLEKYQQKSQWTFFNNTAPKLAPLSATIVQFSLNRRF
jgi:hypothetical protein